MRKRRYIYTYSPRRGYIEQRRGGWWALWLAVLAGVALMGVWLTFSGGGSSSDGAAVREATNARVGDRAPSWVPDAFLDEERRQGGGVPSFEYAGSEAPPPITGLAAAVVDEPCGAMLYDYNAGLRVPPASLTKIATALVAIEQTELTDIVEVNVSGGEMSASLNATVMGIEPGMQLSMLDLLYGMMLPSGNDAALAIAEHIAGSEEAFAQLMNAKVEELGLADTQFTNPHGLDDPALFTSAHDIAMLGRTLLSQPELAQIVHARSYQPNWDGPVVENHNLLLSLYPGALGIKTGYTDVAGQTLVAAAERGSRRVIVSVLGSQDIYADAISLLDWAFYSTPPACGAVSEVAPQAGGARSPQ